MMMRRTFTREFKLAVCQQAEAGHTTKARLCREHALSPSLLDRWIEQYRLKGEDAFAGQAWQATRNSQRVSNQRARSCARPRPPGDCVPPGGSGKVATEAREKILVIRSRSVPLPVLDCCRLLDVSRAGIYRLFRERSTQEDAALEALAGAHPRFGYRRLAALAGKTQKTTRLAMGRLGLMAKRKARRVRTTVPVQAPNLCRKPSAPGELLVSDFTYIAMSRGFAYLAITLDVFTRTVRGWSLQRSMKGSLTLDALAQAMACGSLPQGWVHHSDRASQYASLAFRTLVLSQGGRQ